MNITPKIIKVNERYFINSFSFRVKALIAKTNPVINNNKPIMTTYQFVRNVGK